MSGPYDSYGSQYPLQQGGYPPQQGYNNYQQPQQYQQQQPYPPYDQQQHNFAPPRRADSFGPPQAGGFQHGQAGGQFGTYDASNPQGHTGYYGQPQQYPPQPQHYGGGGNDAYAEAQAYQANMGQNTQQWNQAVEGHEFAKQSSDPNAPNYDPNAPPMSEGERGLLGAIGGGVGGHFLGKKANHGLLGTLGGAILGSLSEDMLKKQKGKHGKHSHGSHHGSQSSWGGGRS